MSEQHTLSGPDPLLGQLLGERYLVLRRLGQGGMGAVYEARHVLIDKAAEELYPTWRQNVEQWNRVGGDFGYHYLGSAIWFNRIGKAMAEAMRELMEHSN